MKKAIFKLMAILVLGIFLLSPSVTAGIIEQEIYGQAPNKGLIHLPPLRTAVAEESENEFYQTSDPGVNEKFIPSDYDITKFLENNKLGYQKVWEPWLTKAAVRCIATDPSYEFLAVGGGYLYDNEIHIYRWNGFTREYDKVWDSGDMIIQGDVLSIDFGDTDNNNFLEIVAGSADGHVYVFEQEHIFDPFDNMENQFVHVWTSPKIQQVWGVKIADVDKDYLPDIIAGSWDEKIHVYEYINHSGYPFTKDHWIEYAEKTTIPVGEKIYSLNVGDTNNNHLPEIVVGTQLGRIYIYENNGTILKINGIDWPLTQDNSYRYHWDSGNVSWNPIYRVIVDDLDDDPHDEIVYISMGQNVFVINFDETIGTSGRYLTHQLWEPFDSWELGGFEGLGHYLNHYIDFMTWSNNVNMTSDAYKYFNSTHFERYHVYPNGTMVPTGEYHPINDLHVYWYGSNTWIAEPFAYMWEPQWPKNTSAAIHRKLDPWGEDGVNIADPPISHPPAENYTVLNARDTYASAVFDWGNDQEVMGDGLWAIPEELLGYDVTLRFHESYLPNLNQMSFEISQDGNTWVEVPKKDISTALVSVAAGDDDLLLDVDPILSAHHWPYFRYMRINVTDHGYVWLKGGYAPVMYRPLDTATSITIGHLDLDYYKAYLTGEQEGKKIVLGTADGKIVMFEYNSATKGYDLLWNSYKNDSYTYGTNIWDIVEVKSPGKIPTWQYNESSSEILDYPFEIAPTYGDFYSVTHVSLFDAFFTAIFESVPAFQPFQNIIDLKIPKNDMVIGTTEGKLVVVPELTHQVSELGDLFFAYVNNDPFYNGLSLTPTFIDLNSDQDYFPEVMLLGWGDPNDLYSPEDYESNQAWAGMDVYTYDPLLGPLGVYGGKIELQQLELTGLLARAFEKSQNIPDAAVGDMDGDGDQDIVITNGRIYYVENINNALFVLDPDYFQDLNDQTTDKLYTSPELYDFDQDGDLDLTLGYSNREGTTYFENVGSRWAPEWRENKWLYTNSWGGLWFNNLTSTALAIGDDGKVTHITCYNNWTGQITQLKAEYENHNAFVIGTNPLIARLEMNLKSGTDTNGNMLANYGYHVFETWNSEAELARWTMTLKTGDTDGDGRNEVIVGDYDSNMYVFEHLTNNTYKRAYRAQDVTHDELSLYSPYAYQELEGVSGTFYRKIWDHINELVVNLDMDGDGFQEIVATAGLSIFIWEQKNDGFVSIDDEYTLIWQADLRQSAWAPFFYDLGITEFTASAWGGDLDYNGYGEFILAAGSFLFVFESNGANGFGDNFLVNPWPVRGRYFVPGNPFTSPAVRTLSIESIVVGDTDNDTLNEIIIGGLNKTWWGQYNGFVAILENQIGTYAYIWWAPNHLMEDNPVYDLAIDNQDYDIYKEIIVGSFKGIVIYENGENPNYPYTRDNFYFERSILTSYVNFPYIHLEQMFDVETKVQLALRNTDFIELQTDLSANYQVGVWLQIFKAGNYLYFATSDDYGITWTQHGRVTTSSLLARYQSLAGPWVSAPMSYSIAEFHPSLYQSDDGRIWLAFSGALAFPQWSYQGIWLLELEDQGGTLVWINAIFDPTVNTVRSVAVYGSTLYNPSVWEFENNTDYGVAISYMNDTDGGIYWSGTFVTGAPYYGGRIPNIGKSSYENNQTWGRVGYEAFAHDTIHGASGNVIIVFSGRSFKEGKVDLDLWIAKGNSTPYWDSVFPYSRATVDGIDELHPSITETITPDHTLMVIFEADGFEPSGALQVIYSKNDGNTWRDPEPVTTTPPFAEWVVVPYFGFSMLVLKDNPFVLVRSLQSVGPAISAHYEGGFVYSFMAQYQLFTPVAYQGLKTQSLSAYTVGSGYSASLLTQALSSKSTGDISSHSGLVENIGGGMTTGGGTLSYSGSTIGTLVNITEGGGGSAITYTRLTQASPPVVDYTSPVVSGDQTFTAMGGSVVAYGDDAAGTDNPDEDPNQGTGYGGGATAATTGFARWGGQDFHRDRKETDRGYWNNIFFGMNPSSNFTQFDFKEAKAISVGDTDKDYRREIGIASESQVYLVEVARTGGSYDEKDQVLFYYQAWHSDSLATPCTDIELFDANGNGMDELIVSCQQGNVYAFEGINTNPNPTHYLYVDWEDMLWRNDTFIGNYYGLDPEPEELTDITDIGLDDVDDLVVASMDPTDYGYSGYPILTVYNGNTGVPYWNYNLSLYLSRQSSILYLKTTDLDLDGVKDVALLAYDYNDAILYLIGFSLDENGPTELWETVSFKVYEVNASELHGIYLEDLTGDGIDDFFISISESVFFVNGATGNNDEGPELFYEFSSSEWTVNNVAFNNQTVLISGYRMNSDNGLVIWLNASKGIIHEFPRNTSMQGLTAELIDLTDDSFADVVIFESGIIYVFDGVPDENGTFTDLGNITIEGAIGNYPATLKFDFNSDLADDILVQLRFNIQSMNPKLTADFEDLNVGTSVGESYDGLLFSGSSNWIVYNGSLSGTYVPHSGDLAVYNSGYDNEIIIENFATKISAYFSVASGRGFTWAAYDYHGNLLSNVTLESGKPTQYRELSDPLGRIYQVRVINTSANYDAYFVMDDFSYYSHGVTSMMAFSGLDLDVLWEYHLWETYADEIKMADIDRDGETDDLLFTTVARPGAQYHHTGAVSAIDGSYGTPLLNIQIYGMVQSLAAGNFGDYGEIALVSYTGQVIMVTWVRNEPTKYQEVAIQMDASTAFESRGIITKLETGSFNLDGIDDVVFGDSQRYIIALDGTTADMIWKYRVPTPIMQMKVWDLNGDGYSDIAVALKGGMLYIINGETGRPIWKDYLGPTIVNDLQFVDVESDGEMELAISMGFIWTANLGRFVLYNTTRDENTGHGTVRFERWMIAPYTRIEIADFDTSNGNFLDFAVQIYGLAIHLMRGNDGSTITAIFEDVQDFGVGDFTDYTLPEIALIIRNGTVATYVGTSNWSSYFRNNKVQLDIPLRLSHLEIGDFVGNELDDIVVRSLGDATYCFNGGLVLEWIFEDRSIYYLPEFKIADLNNDSKLDIISLNYDNILALNGEPREPTQVIWASFVPNGLVRSITLGDFNADGITDIAIGTRDHWVYILHGKEEQLVTQQFRRDQSIKSTEEVPLTVFMEELEVKEEYVCPLQILIFLPFLYATLIIPFILGKKIWRQR